MTMEQLPDTFLNLFGGYSALFAILALYIFSLGRRVARLESRPRDEK